jgi:dipeptidase
MYASINKVPEAFAVGNGSMMEFSPDAGFWVFNLVSNFAYTRYNVIHPEIRSEQTQLEDRFLNETKVIDAKALVAYKTDKASAVSVLTEYSVNTGNETVKHWSEFFAYLFTKFMDGNVKTKVNVPDGYKYHVPTLVQPGYSESWYRRIAEETGDHFKMPDGAGH